MLRRRTAILVVTGLFLAALLLSLFTHSTGVVRNDPARNIWIPRELTMPVQLQVAYDEAQIFFRYRWPAEQPHVLTDLLRYSGGKWQRQLHSPVGSDPDGIAEDRLAMMVDDGKGDDESPDIVKLSLKEFVTAMEEYQTGVRTKNAKMARAAKRLTPAEVANLAAYYETLK